MKNSLITSGQKDQVVQVVVAAVRKGMEKMMEELTRTLHASDLQRVLAQGDALAGHLITESKKKMIELAGQVVGYLRLISSGMEIIIGPTDGQETIAQARGLFKGWIDKYFVECIGIKDHPTKETSVQVFEMINSRTFGQIFGGFGENLDRLCFSQGQVVSFARNHSKWFRRYGPGTFFLLKINGDYLVARVFWGTGNLDIVHFPLSYNKFWEVEDTPRVVVPKL